MPAGRSDRVHELLTFARELGKAALSLIYPPRCAVCRDFGEEIVCAGCLASFQELAGLLCRRCGVPLPDGRTDTAFCARCTEGPPYHFTWARARGQFDGALRTAIHRLKYDGRRGVARTLGVWMQDGPTSARGLPAKPDLVVPVPLHPARRWRRGFNQSELLAEAYIGDRNWPLALDLLFRVRNTRPQVSLSPEKREANVRNAFRVARPERIAGRRVLVVDDVLTTLHTVNECSRVLKEAGAAEVYVVAVAR